MTDWKEGEPPKDGRWYMALDCGSEPVAVMFADKRSRFVDNKGCAWGVTHHNPEPIDLPKPRPGWLPDGWSFDGGEVLNEEGTFVAKRSGTRMVFWMPSALSASELSALTRIAENLEAGRDWDSDEGGEG